MPFKDNNKQEDGLVLKYKEDLKMYSKDILE
jgi:hypothetical protein